MNRIDCESKSLLMFVLKPYYFFFFLLAAMAFTSASARGGEVPAVPNLRESQFSYSERRILRVLGDRLQKPGKESLTFNGTLDQFTGGKKTSMSQVTVVWQYPGLLRMDYAGANQSVIFDGKKSGKQGGNVTQDDNDLIESVAKDSADSFLLGRFSGSTVQLIGQNYNIKDPRSTNRLAGQCDLLKVTEIDGVRGQGSKVEKTYCFDSATSLLKAVLYLDGGAVIETRYSGWRNVDGQAVPSSIQRWNNSTQVLALTFLNVAISGKQDAAKFNLP